MCVVVSVWHFRGGRREYRSARSRATAFRDALVPLPGLGLNDGYRHRARANRTIPVMIDPKSLDALVGRVADSLPAGFGQVHEDLRNNLHAALSAALARMDLVSREEFDVQSAVLARTRKKLTALETKVAELEGTVDIDQAPPTPKPPG